MPVRHRSALIAALAAVCAVLGLSTAATGEPGTTSAGHAIDRRDAGTGSSASASGSSQAGRPARPAHSAARPATAHTTPATADVLRDLRPHPAITSVSPGAGAISGGEVVQVYGRNLTSAAGVMFGDVPGLDVHVVSAGHLTVRAPAQAAAGVDLRLEQGSWLSSPTAVDRYDYLAPTAAPTWGQPVSVDPPHDATMRVDCPSATFCGVAEPHDLFTLVNGQKQTPSTTLPMTQTIDAIDCPATNECVAVGHSSDNSGVAAVLHNNAWTIATPAELSSSTYLWSLSCGSAQSCWAVNSFSGQRVQWNGNVWTTDTTVPNAARVSCVSDAFCMVVATGFAQIWDGSAWGASTPVPSLMPYAVSCSADNACSATSTTGPWRWTGQEWAHDASPGTDPPFAAKLQCTSAADCVAITYPSSGVSAPFKSWQRDQSGWRRIGAVDPDLRALSLSCWADGACLAGLDGFTTTLSNDTWTRSARIDLGTSSVSTISCPTSTDCVAADGRGNALYETSGHWSTPAPPAGNVARVSSPITCVSTAACYAPEVFYDGSTWSAKRFVPRPLSGRDLVGCVGPSFCLAVSYQTVYSVWNGAEWSGTSTLLPLGPDVSATPPHCPAAGVCYLLYPNGAFYSLRGKDWVRYPATAAAVPGGSVITCSGTDFCVAVSGASSSQVFHGGRWWSTGSTFRGNRVDCRAVNDCLAATTSNSVAHWNGLTWQEVRPAGTTYVSVITHRGSTWIVSYSDGTVVEGA